MDAFENKIVETDDPSWIEAECEVDRTSDAETQAACDLLSVRHGRSYGSRAACGPADSKGWPSHVSTASGEKSRSWHTVLIENIAVVLTMGLSEVAH
ncbi:hypothetical protein ACSHT2_03350 [Bradyrhizobium sp. PUT101]|uniref:hypothetical protein n=1 Tax=Bradyrhizobium sp. PUT101 TaxID=3447427 RepID=UPI003F84D9EC